MTEICHPCSYLLCSTSWSGRRTRAWTTGGLYLCLSGAAISEHFDLFSHLINGSVILLL